MAPSIYNLLELYKSVPKLSQNDLLQIGLIPWLGLDKYRYVKEE